MKRNNRVMQVVAGVVGCLVLAASGYAQTLDKGEVEATGQVGIVTGINTHASFAGSVGKAVTDHIFALGEFGYIPAGGPSASGTSPTGGFAFDANGHVLTFMGGAQYQFAQQRSFVPYAGGAIGLVHLSGGVKSTVSGSSTTIDFSDNKFYASFGGGARYYVKDRWGFKPELMIFAGDDSFFRFAVGVFYQFRR